MASGPCETKNTEVLAELDYSEGEVDTFMYGSVPKLLTFEQLDDQASILKKIEDKNGANGWDVIVTCVDSESVYISLSSVGIINEYSNGVIILKNQKYFAGPLSLLPKTEVIIQVDKL